MQTAMDPQCKGRREVLNANRGSGRREWTDSRVDAAVMRTLRAQESGLGKGRERNTYSEIPFLLKRGPTARRPDGWGGGGGGSERRKSSPGMSDEDDFDIVTVAAAVADDDEAQVVVVIGGGDVEPGGRGGGSPSVDDLRERGSRRRRAFRPAVRPLSGIIAPSRRSVMCANG